MTGGFDNFNPFIAKGRSLGAIQLFVYDTLTKRSLDEAGSEYGLIAKSMEIASDYSFVIFTLRPEARFQDGTPITPEDVVFSFDILKEKGNPFYRFYYKNVKAVEAPDKTRVKFTFDSAGNRELPQIMGQLPILPKHYWKDKDFAATTLTPPIGSGPYKIGGFEANQRITFERVKNYWGAALPVNLGMNNFDRISYINFADLDVQLQGLFADSYDFRTENSARNWATAYEGKPAVTSGALHREQIILLEPKPMQAFVVNLRRSKFVDPKVRLALDYAFDFEWANKNFFYGQYARTTSFFQNSEMAAQGLPDKLELELLEPFRNKVPPEVFTYPFSEPQTDGSGADRDNLRKAAELLKLAGWQVENGVLTNAQTKEKMVIEYLEFDTGLEKVVLAYKDRLARLGIRLQPRLVDEAQYINRLRNFDFDMITYGIQQSLSPGNEQREYWGSTAASRPESRNVMGIKNPVVDVLIDKIIFAPDRAHLVAACRALDRVLLWNRYVIPGWNAPYERLAYWNRFGRPKIMPRYDVGFPEIWWYDATRAAKTGKARN
jgi:microcin C transport system substrate-binding protein